jgi:polysaccharide deacetylase family protein (PEP-CTERM system associated)
MKIPSLQASAETAAYPRTHIMSVDVEEYFMVEAFAGTVPRSSWGDWPSRVVASTQAILDLFERHQVTATFFFVGWIAKRYPELVREVAARGHDLANHSYWHRTVYSLSRDEFREDTRAATAAIEDAAGVKVCGYRAPSWSITNECIWALDILAEQGLRYDSSIFPIHHDLYGVVGAERFPYTIPCANGSTLIEYPPATVRVLGQNLPGAGGGYLRILPMIYTEWVFRKFEEEYGKRVVVYIHPWELDPLQPRIKDKMRSTIRHYTNLNRMQAKLTKLVSKYTFRSFESILLQNDQIASSDIDVAPMAKG